MKKNTIFRRVKKHSHFKKLCEFSMLFVLNTMFDNSINMRWLECAIDNCEGGKMSYEVLTQKNHKMRYEVFVQMIHSYIL